jgi:hypothetical protein
MEKDRPRIEITNARMGAALFVHSRKNSWMASYRIEGRHTVELPPTLYFGDAARDALLPSVLRPQGGAFKGEL